MKFGVRATAKAERDVSEVLEWPYAGLFKQRVARLNLSSLRRFGRGS